MLLTSQRREGRPGGANYVAVGVADANCVAVGVAVSVAVVGAVGGAVVSGFRSEPNISSVDRGVVVAGGQWGHGVIINGAGG